MMTTNKKCIEIYFFQQKGVEPFEFKSCHNLFRSHAFFPTLSHILLSDQMFFLVQKSNISTKTQHSIFSVAVNSKSHQSEDSHSCCQE